MNTYPSEDIYYNLDLTQNGCETECNTRSSEKNCDYFGKKIYKLFKPPLLHLWLRFWIGPND